MTFRSTTSAPRSPVIMEEVVVSDDGDKPSAAAVDIFCFAARRDAARMAPVNPQPGFGHRLGHHRFHLVVRCLQVVAGPLSRANIGAKMNPCFRSWHELRPPLDEGLEAQVTELMAA